MDVDLSGETLVAASVGANAMAGHAYVFVRSTGVWTQEALLEASNPATFDQFGDSVAILGDTIAVGASIEESGSTTDQADNSAIRAGAVYIFTRSGTIWTQEAYVKASNVALESRFGKSVSLEVDKLAVGSYWQDDTFTDSGAAYIFTRSGTTWTQQSFIKAPNLEASDEFGISIVLSGDDLLVGAHYEDSVGKGVGGEGLHDDNTSAESGAIYINP